MPTRFFDAGTQGLGDGFEGPPVREPEQRGDSGSGESHHGEKGHKAPAHVVVVLIVAARVHCCCVPPAALSCRSIHGAWRKLASHGELDGPH